MEHQKLLILAPLGIVLGVVVILMILPPISSVQPPPLSTTTASMQSPPLSTTTTSVQPPPLPLEQRIAPLILDSITKYEVQFLDGTVLRTRVEAGQTITLTLGERLVEIQLEPNELRAPEYVATLPPEQREVFTYKGTVVGEPDSSVRLSLRPNVVRGYIIMGLEWWFIEPLTNFGDPATVDAPINTHIIYRTRDVKFTADLSNDVITTTSNPESNSTA